jgi:hypothetical protein
MRFVIYKSKEKFVVGFEMNLCKCKNVLSSCVQIKDICNTLPAAVKFFFLNLPSSGSKSIIERIQTGIGHPRS